MKIHYQKDLQVLLSALLISASMLTALPQIESAWTGVKEEDFGLRILRGAMLVALASRDGGNKPIGLDGCPLLYTSPSYGLPPLEKGGWGGEYARGRDTSRMIEKIPPNPPFPKGGTGQSTEKTDDKVRGLR